jgi:RNA polymerase sigma-70 factor (ECF subfamily)
MTRCPSGRYLTTSAIGQPAVVFYLGAQASGPHLAWSIAVLTLRDTRIAEITSFLEPNYFTPFGSRPHWPDRNGHLPSKE